MIPKFRAWYKANKKMYKVNGISYPLRMLSLFSKDLYVEDLNASFDDVIIMQSTGLFDKNDVEMFEGDVIEWFHTEGDYVTQNGSFYVMWKNGGFRKHDEIYYDLFDICDLDWFEVIGNIYENPELVQE